MILSIILIIALFIIYKRATAEETPCPGCNYQAVNCCDIDYCCEKCRAEYYKNHVNFEDRFDVGYDLKGPHLIKKKKHN